MRINEKRRQFGAASFFVLQLEGDCCRSEYEPRITRICANEGRNGLFGDANCARLTMIYH
jgi:hypothetical protein